MGSILKSAIGCLLVSSIVPSALAAGPLALGVKAGVVMASVTPREINGFAELEGKIGPVGGAFATWELSRLFALQGELLYVSKGLSFGESEATDEAGNLLGTFETLRVLDYLEIPLLVRAAWAARGPLRPALVVGPAIAFKLSERQKTTGSVEGSQETDGFASFDVGLAAGAELRFRTGPGWTLMETRYTMGLVDVAEDFYDREKRNRSLTIMAGYAF